MYCHDIHVQVQVSSSIDGHGFCTHLEAMPIHAHLETIPTHAHPCPPMNNNIEPMPTQNPWAWVGSGMGVRIENYTQCRALFHMHLPYAQIQTLQNEVVERIENIP
jgi:hypothetical protein